jgi:hypothetical protein
VDESYYRELINLYYSLSDTEHTTAIACCHILDLCLANKLSFICEDMATGILDALIELPADHAAAIRNTNKSSFLQLFSRLCAEAPPQHRVAEWLIKNITSQSKIAETEGPRTCPDRSAAVPEKNYEHV